MSDDNKELVLKCLGLYAKGDLESVAPLLRDDYADHGLPFRTATKAEWIAAAGNCPSQSSGSTSAVWWRKSTT